MNDLLVSALLIACVVAVIIAVQIVTTRKREHHRYGVIIIPVGKSPSDVRQTCCCVKTAVHEESFYNFSDGREIFIVDFGCRPDEWEEYLLLSRKYKKVHAIKSYELYAYLKVKSG